MVLDFLKEAAQRSKVKGLTAQNSVQEIKDFIAENRHPNPRPKTFFDKLKNVFEKCFKNIVSDLKQRFGPR